MALHHGGGKISETGMGLEAIIFTGLTIMSRDLRKVKMPMEGEGRVAK